MKAFAALVSALCIGAVNSQLSCNVDSSTCTGLSYPLAGGGTGACSSGLVYDGTTFDQINCFDTFASEAAALALCTGAANPTPLIVNCDSYLVNCCLITQAPTGSPSTTPTQNPTQTPTTSPTQNPTTSPTQNPTKSPTTTPTKNPTGSPVVQPEIPPGFFDITENQIIVGAGGGGGLLFLLALIFLLRRRRNSSSGDEKQIAPTGGAGGKKVKLDEKSDIFDWEKHIDKKSGEVYFFNPKTGESRWDPPEVSA